MLRVNEIMSRNVVELPSDTPIEEAAQIMSEERVGSVIVVHNDQAVGIVTEADMTRKIVAAGCHLDSTLQAIMSAPLYYTKLDSDIQEVANSMTLNNIKKIPVIDGGQVMGIVTQTDIIKHVFRAVRTMQRQVETGHISAEDFIARSGALFRASNPSDAVKNWYMRCKSCSFTFSNPEEGGSFKLKKCPKCGSDSIDFDQDPSVL